MILESSSSTEHCLPSTSAEAKPEFIFPEAELEEGGKEAGNRETSLCFAAATTLTFRFFQG